MKNMRILLTALLLLSTFALMAKQQHQGKMEKAGIITKDSLLRHVVLFKFKEGTPAEKIEQIEKAFGALQEKIPQIHAYEWGLNNSPEGLDKGFTHCFLLTFKSEEDRAIYLPHPDHKAFGSLLGGHLEDVLVIDYWAP